MTDIPERTQAALRRAFDHRDAAAVRRLIEAEPAARALLDAPVFPFDSPALVHLSGSGDVEMVRTLLELGADPNRKSDWWAGGFHALHGATPAIAELLLEAGAVPDACAAAHLDRIDLLRRILDEDAARVHERGGDGKTPLHFARSRAVADLLLERGADIDARDVDHRSTPAQWMLDRAWGAGRYELARHLVDRGAAADIFLACALGLVEPLRAMLEADPAPLDLRTTQGDYDAKPPSSWHIYFWTIGPNLSPFQVATRFDQWEALEVLRSFASPRQLFIAACMDARESEALRLLHERPGLLDELSTADHRALADAAWAPEPAAVELMMELGFDPAVTGHDGGTALHCAAWEGSAAAVDAILRHPRGRRLIDARDARYGATPLGWCCHGARHAGPAEHVRVARLLLEAGARPGPDTADAPDAIRAVIRSHIPT